MLEPEEGDSSLTLNWPSLVSFCQERANRCVRAHAVKQQDSGGAALTGGVETGTSSASGGECSFMKATPYARDWRQTHSKDSLTHRSAAMCLEGLSCSPCCTADCTRSSHSPTSPAPWPSPAGSARRSARGLCSCRYGSLWATWRTTWPAEPTTPERCINSAENDTLLRLNVQVIHPI